MRITVGSGASASITGLVTSRDVVLQDAKNRGSIGKMIRIAFMFVENMDVQRYEISFYSWSCD